jgi:hypothetical protein
VPLRLELYSADHVEKVRRFNHRLRKGNVEPGFFLPESAALEATRDALPCAGAAFVKRHFIMVDDQEVRGGFLLQEQLCCLAGETRWCANIQMPISEGVVDRKFSHIAVRMIELLLRDRPLVFAVGMGSLHAPFAKFLAAMKWRVTLVPFRFYVLQPSRFLEQTRALRNTRWRSTVADFAAVSGLGSAAIRVGQRLRKRGSARLSAHRIDAWYAQTSSLWMMYRASSSFCVVRDKASLPFFLDLTGSDLSSYMFTDRDGIVRGWAVLKMKAMRDNKYFGSLRVATLLDGVCEPSFERAVVQATVYCAQENAADILVMNQLSDGWLAASEQSGFWRGPSNYVFASSPALTKSIASVDPDFSNVHCSRADGDGRLNL